MKWKRANQGIQMMTIIQEWYRFFQKQEGQSLMETSLILFFVALVTVAALILLGNQVLAFFQNFVNLF